MERIPPCPPDQHHWQRNGYRLSGHNRRQKWKCSKCGQETIVESLVQSSQH